MEVQMRIITNRPCPGFQVSWGMQFVTGFGAVLIWVRYPRGLLPREGGETGHVGVHGR